MSAYSDVCRASDAVVIAIQAVQSATSYPGPHNLELLDLLPQLGEIKARLNAAAAVAHRAGETP
jgi:hypothetical protein